MIVIEVELPFLEKTYDFEVDETIPVEFLMSEMLDMICRRESCRLTGDIRELMLLDKRNKIRIIQGQTLKDYKIKSGSTLLLL